MATRLKENCESKTITPIIKKSASKKTMKAQKPEKAEKTKAEYELELAMLTNELKTANYKITCLEKKTSQMSDVCWQLSEMVKELNSRCQRLEEMAERTFVILKVLEGNQHKIIKIGLEGIARKNLRLEKKTFSVEEVVKGFSVSRTTLNRWVNGTETNPDKKIRQSYDLDSRRPYFKYTELLEDILNDMVPTNKSKDVLLGLLEAMAGKTTISDNINQNQEKLPEEFYEL